MTRASRGPARDQGRETILLAVRAELARSPRGAAAGPPRPAATRAASATPDALSSAFAARLSAAGGHVHAAADADAAARLIARLASERGARRIAVADAPLLAAMVPHWPGEILAPDAPRERLLGADLGITTAQYGVAETGSLVLISGAERHRLLSLLPAVHVAVLPAGRIVATLRDALAAARGSDPMPPAAVTLITGPSRTADIELTLVVGVHGPKELHVVRCGA